MNIALVADAFFPLRTSCAVMWRDLALELVQQGHNPTVIIPCDDLKQPWSHEYMQGVEIIRLKAPKTKDINYISRTINEFLMPFFMLRSLNKSPLKSKRWDGIVWYSPTIFFGPLIKRLKLRNSVPSYLILRDIFPDWALDLGLIKKGLAYYFLKSIAAYQYSIADVIGVQSPGNLDVLYAKTTLPKKKIEVLYNWIAEPINVDCTFSLQKKLDELHGRIIFVYAGNMGVAQNMDTVIRLAEKFKDRLDVGFLLVGRGSELSRLQRDVELLELSNVVFHDEIDPLEIPNLLTKCHIGLVLLDPRHKTHNIPGKFMSYMQSGLPVLAYINPNSDLEKMIKNDSVGMVCTDISINSLYNMALLLIRDLSIDTNIQERCRQFAMKHFSAKTAVKKILNTFVNM